MIEIGSIRAIIAGIATQRDGGFKITIEVNPDNHEVISRLTERFARDERVLEVGIVALNKDEL